LVGGEGKGGEHKGGKWWRRGGHKEKMVEKAEGIALNL